MVVYDSHPIVKYSLDVDMKKFLTASLICNLFLIFYLLIWALSESRNGGNEGRDRYINCREILKSLTVYNGPNKRQFAPYLVHMEVMKEIFDSQGIHSFYVLREALDDDKFIDFSHNSAVIYELDGNIMHLIDESESSSTDSIDESKYNLVRCITR